MELGLICGIVLAALTLSLVLKKDAPAIAFLLVLTAGVILLLRVFSAAGSAAQRFSGLLSQCGLDSALYLLCRCARQSVWRSWCGLQLRFAGMPVSPRLPPRWRLQALS